LPAKNLGLHLHLTISRMKFKLSLPVWVMVVPFVAWLLYFLKPYPLSDVYAIILACTLIAAVMAAVHHAAVVAHRVAAPYGVLVLAVAVTVIEVSLIISFMLSGGPEADALARDTVFAAVMIILAGMIGLCLLVGGLRYKEQLFGRHGVSAALVTL